VTSSGLPQGQRLRDFLLHLMTDGGTCRRARGAGGGDRVTYRVPGFGRGGTKTGVSLDEAVSYATSGDMDSRRYRIAIPCARLEHAIDTAWTRQMAASEGTEETAGNRQSRPVRQAAVPG